MDIGSEEFKFANRSFISRHPAATTWISTHSFYLCKLDIVQIVVLDWYGGPHFVSTTDYYNAKTATNGFLDYGLSTEIVEPRDDSNRLSTSGRMNVESRGDGKIKIEIKKGQVAVTIEL